MNDNWNEGIVVVTLAGSGAILTLVGAVMAARGTSTLVGAVLVVAGIADLIAAFVVRTRKS